jgi:hypothetical protein
MRLLQGEREIVPFACVITTTNIVHVISLLLFTTRLRKHAKAVKCICFREESLEELDWGRSKLCKLEHVTLLLPSLLHSSDCSHLLYLSLLAGKL